MMRFIRILADIFLLFREIKKFIIISIKLSKRDKTEINSLCFKYLNQLINDGKFITYDIELKYEDNLFYVVNSDCFVERESEISVYKLYRILKSIAKQDYCREIAKRDDSYIITKRKERNIRILKKVQEKLNERK